MSKTNIFFGILVVLFVAVFGILTTVLIKVLPQHILSFMYLLMFVMVMGVTLGIESIYDFSVAFMSKHEARFDKIISATSIKLRFFGNSLKKHSWKVKFQVLSRLLAFKLFVRKCLMKSGLVDLKPSLYEKYQKVHSQLSD